MAAHIGQFLSPAVATRLDRNFMLRAPMLWRTRLPYFVIFLIIAVSAIVPFVQLRVPRVNEVYVLSESVIFLWTVGWWCVSAVLFMWVVFIIRKRVGEVPPSRHIVTFIAVAIGSYLCLTLPNLLASQQIRAIGLSGPPDEILNSDLAVLSRYNNWTCIPQNVSSDNNELVELRQILYYYDGYISELKPKKYDELDGEYEKDAFIKRCKDKSQGILNVGGYAKMIISIISDARDFEHENTTENNKFSAIAVPHFWWFAAALGIGVLTVALSYPFYIWRRVFK